MKVLQLASARLLITLVLHGAAFEALAVLPSGHDELPNFDRRASGQQALIAPERRTALETLNARLPDAVVDFDELARPKWVRSQQGFLTGSNGQGRAVSAEARAQYAAQERHAATKAFLREHSSLFGFGPEALVGARIAEPCLTGGIRCQTTSRTISSAVALGLQRGALERGSRAS